MNQDKALALQLAEDAEAANARYLATGEGVAELSMYVSNLAARIKELVYSA